MVTRTERRANRSASSGVGKMNGPLEQHSEAILKALDGVTPDWNLASDSWIELSLAAKGTAWEATVDWMGPLVAARDAIKLRDGLTALLRTNS